jgi:hypothetical protein
MHGRLRGLRRPYACPPSPTRSLSSRLAGEPSSGTQGVSCCFSTSLSPGSVSAQSTPHASTLARLPCAHLRAETHFNRYLLIQRSCVRSYAPSVQRIDARGFGKVKRQTARRHGINIYNQIPRGWRGYRGRRGAPDASDDMCPAANRLWAGLARDFPPRLPRLGCRFRGRLCGPAFRGSWRGCPALAKALFVASACAHAVALDRYVTRDLAHVWVGPASTKCAMLSRGGTTHGLGHWEGVSSVLCDRLGVVLELAWPLWSSRTGGTEELRFCRGRCE